MIFLESARAPSPAPAFTVFIPSALQSRMEALPGSTRQTLVEELFRLAAQAGQERSLLPRLGAVILEFQLAGCDVNLELDATQARLTLVSLVAGPN